MTRCRTHAKKDITIISNETAQADYLSWEALGLLTYCLSMPASWDFYPKEIWRRGRSGRDKIYTLFNELIQNGHCIRIKKANSKNPKLAGEVEYEIFDDPRICMARVIELSETEKFIECREEFKKYFRHPENQEAVDNPQKLKKCLRRPAFRDPKIRDPENPEEIKPIQEENHILEKTTNPTLPKEEGTLKRFGGGGSSDAKEPYECFKSLDISDKDKMRATKNYPIGLVQEVVSYITRPTFKPNTTLDAALFYYLKNPSHLTPNKEDIEKSKIQEEEAKMVIINNRISAMDKITKFLWGYAKERGHDTTTTPLMSSAQTYVEFRGRKKVKLYYEDPAFKVQLEQAIRYYEPLDEENRKGMLDYIKDME